MTREHGTRDNSPCSALSRRVGLCLATVFALLVPERAQTQTDLPNTCISGGRGDYCITTGDCGDNAWATECVLGACQIPCEDGVGEPLAHQCALGETCVIGEGDQGPVHYCQATSFRMDLNQLDVCLSHFLRGTVPDLSGTSSCSLERNLNLLLDQDGNSTFNIFDVDGCINAFWERVSCTSFGGGYCPPGYTYCEADDDCGEGLHCDQDLHHCERECGLIANREDIGAEILERPCAGSLKMCDYTLGRCDPADLSGSTCHVDEDCPAAAYCFVGECQPMCSRSIDCPDSGWFCNAARRCEPLPPPGSAGSGFDPKDYVVKFAEKDIRLTPVENDFEIPLLVMNVQTRRQEFDNPAAVFGYRLEIQYARKQEPKCQTSFVDCSMEEQRPMVSLPTGEERRETEAECNTRQADCIIDETQEFVTLLSPFGTVYADGAATMPIMLNDEATERLSPGRYQATLRAIYNNGGQDSLIIRFEKTTLSGGYSGQLSVYLETPDNRLGNTNLSLEVFLDEDAPAIQWQQLLLNENISAEAADIIDVTEGVPVVGYIRGDDTMVFNAPAALRRTDNLVALKGIYSARLNRMRLVGVIDIPAEHCVSEEGACDGASGAQRVTVENVFGRTVRRLLLFDGPFDSRTRHYHGLFRETISGLAPYDVTMEGGFSLRQIAARSEAPSEVAQIGSRALMPASQADAVGFPSSEVLLGGLLQGEIDEHCGRFPNATAHFSSRGAFESYLARWGAGTDEPILASLLTFEGELQNAISQLEADGGAALTLHEFLGARVHFCEEGGGGGGDACVDEGAVRCGLALQRKAILSGWIDMGASDDPNSGQFCEVSADCERNPLATKCVEGTCEIPCEDATGAALPEVCPANKTCELAEDDEGAVYTCVGRTAGGGHDLFCSPLRPTLGCDLNPIDYASIVTLQEHNRFYRELSHALTFKAGSELSEAFFVMYRNAGDTIDQAAALSYKESRLLSAWEQYQGLRRAIFSPQGTAVLFAWPAGQFKGLGAAWLAQMHGALVDRLDALQELIDLKRRVFVTSDEQDFVFLQHLLQEEYLTQVFVAWLQHAWQGDRMQYGGQGPEALRTGEMLLARVNETRNPLGFHPNQVFFENSDITVVNWKNYRKYLLEGVSGGLLVQAEQAVTQAVQEMHAVMQDEQGLESAMLAGRHGFEAEIDSLCGPEEAPPNACPVLSAEERGDEEACLGPSCLYEYSCASNYEDECTSVVRTFSEAVDEGSLADSACRLDTPDYGVTIGSQVRNCVRGQMGALLQEKAHLDLQRKQVYRKIGTLLKRMGVQTKLMQEQQKDDTELLVGLSAYHVATEAAQIAMDSANAVFETVEIQAQSGNCLALVGTANGTNCPTVALAVTAKSAAAGVRAGANAAASSAMRIAAKTKEIILTSQSQQAALRRERAVLENLTMEVDNLISEYELLTQHLFNTQMRLADTQFLAQRAADRYGESVESIVDHLIGNESGSVLRRNEYVQRADVKFQEVLRFTYKMAMAFIHSYNLKAEAEAIVTRVFSIVTPEGVRELINDLEQYERDYCGGAGIDCDAAANTATFRFSVRDELFPDLRDIVDAKTGGVLTKGEQFHNIITSSSYIRRRKRGTYLVDQIELPFAIWLNERRDNPGAVRPWMLPPLECNHIVVGRGGGTMGVNVFGTRLGLLTYELWRGNTDFLRRCSSEEVTPPGGGVPVTEYPIESYVVGRAPHNALAQQDQPPVFVTHMTGEVACKNVPESSQGVVTDENCYRYFARDRSLSAPDWKLVVPLGMGYGNNWILGDGVGEEGRPVVEDIIVYFRYRRRPLDN